MRKKEQKIYFDYAADTPLAREVLKEMFPYLREAFGNPSSIHQFGQKAHGAIDKARERVAKFLNCSISEIFFTGGATEANNLAIFGTIKQAQKYLRRSPHLITSKIEHPSILEPCRQLEKEGVNVTYLEVNREGLVEIPILKEAIRENTVLISIMYANNEIGTIQPIVKIGNLLQKINPQRQRKKIPKIFFHSDAVQAANYLDCNVQKLGVDLLTLSAHKIYGPKGVGVLFAKNGTPISPLIFGGGQEGGLRGGTENVAGIVGFGKAIEGIGKNKREIKRIKNLRDKLLKGILKKVPQVFLNGSQSERLPNNLNLTIPGAEGESMVIALDQEGIALSTGSACSSKSLEPSHVLLALGLTPEQAHCSLRITLGRYTREKEIVRFLKVFPLIVKRLRKLSGYPLK